MLAAIPGATRSVNLLWFSWDSGAITERITATLADRAVHGVRVWILLDSFGALLVDRRQLGVLRRAGCQVASFRPLRHGGSRCSTSAPTAACSSATNSSP